MINICIVDDHTIVREGLKQVLKEVQDISIHAEASSGQELISKLEDSQRTGQLWDVLVLDISLPDVSGIELVKQIRRVSSTLPILILTMHAEDQYAFRAFRAGACGYLTKESASDQLISAIRKVHEGGKFVSANLAEKLVGNLDAEVGLPQHQKLSDREFEVLRLIGDGTSLTEIANRLSLSIKTVSTYRARVLEKLALKSNADLIRYVIDNRLNA